MREDAIEGRLTEMDDIRGSGQERGNENPQMTELRNMVQMLFLKLKPPTFKSGMDPVKANDWILAMEKNFRLLRCGKQQKVEIGSYLLAGEDNCEGSFTNLAKYVPHLVATDEMRARKFEDGLRHEIKKVIRPLVLPTYAEDRIKVRNEIRCFHCNEVGHIKRNCLKLRTETVAPRGGPRGGNVRPVGNARPGAIGREPREQGWKCE
ncbi:hypothetical protein Acr_27g0000550 [Actinidia rufa]|uniref:CCHC-type domain-containing protein n=1 Tax=Actinidia rufa TaxID=165716 RepID=A0A7J0H5E1_9ERIC|nr:hypothetical protein Acr_27g0000550 [Actinidia rufa]